MKAVVVLSGGLDSTTLLYDVVTPYVTGNSDDVHAISFNYGQKHSKELEFAKMHCEALSVTHKIVDISFMRELLADSGSSLVTDEDVPEGHYAQENMKSTVVPNRNMVMASIAASYAISVNADRLYLGAHAGDHFIYPDCRPHFFSALNAAVVIGNEGFGPIGDQSELPVQTQLFVEAPYLHLTKNDIAQMAFDLEVPIEKTWSCYKGGQLHCGRCGTCVERLEAIASTGNIDPTQYEDPFFWRDAGLAVPEDEDA